MAIYHQTTKMVKRSDGRNAVAAAAYRAGISLYEEATGKTHDYSTKMGVEHSEILAPHHAPEWVFDRQTLWNTVEAAEQRWDSQVAREVEVGLPIELTKSEQIELLRDFVKREFVSRGMVADFSLHLDNPENPHAHILLTTRELTAEGFGLKNRGWNQTAELEGWRRGWAEVTNEHLAHAGLAVRIDHRSYREQQLGLTPGRKIGVGLERQHDERLPAFLADRVAEQQRIAEANGLQIIADPKIALQALTHGQATFTHHDIARFLHTRTDGAEQFEHAHLKVTTSPELVSVGTDEQGLQRFTTREMFEHERSMLADAQQLSGRAGHGVSRGRRESVLLNHRLSEEQSQAVEQVTQPGDLKSLVGVAGSGKSTTLAAMRETWEAEGWSVKGAALSGIAAENLQVASGIPARTLASYELAWNGGRDPLTRNDVLVIDEAGMIGTRQLARVLEVAAKHHAKVVLVGDPEQLQAIEAGAPFRGIAAQHGVAELAEVRRQRQAWQRTATEQLASGQTRPALAAYQEQHGIVAVARREDARTALLARWARDAKLDPAGSQLVLAYTRDDVRALNLAVRTLRQQTGQLGEGQVIGTAQGPKEFSVQDRIRFGRNEKALGVKNGSLGTVQGIEGGVLRIKLDGAEQALTVDTKFYGHLDHGYAATVHKAQGSTVDRTYVLATPHFDRHTTYVAMSRHRESATVWYARDDFGGRGGRVSAEEVQARFVERLSRQQAKDLAHDYLERAAAQVTPDVAEPVPAPQPVIEAAPAVQTAQLKPTLEQIRATARQNWRALRERTLESEGVQTPEDLRQQGRENWQALRADLTAARAPAAAPTVAGEHESGATLSLGDDEPARIARLTAQELRQEIQHLRPEPMSHLVERDVAVHAAARSAAERRQRFNQVQRRERQAQEEAAKWRQAHALQAKLHDLGVASSGFLVDRAATEVEARAERLAALALQESAEVELARARSAAAARIAIETAPVRAKIAQLERVANEKARLERLAREFQALAQQRALNQSGTLHHREEWQATPAVLREAIERFNRLPAAAQETSLQALVAQPEVTESLGQALEQRHERRRDLDHGMGL